MKKTISIFLSVIMMISALGVNASAFAVSKIQPTVQTISVKSIFKSLHFIHLYKLTEIKQPTCTDKGYNKYMCIICDKSYYTYTDTKDHKIVIDPAVPSTCSQMGLTEGSHCSVCGKVIVEQEEIMLLDCNLEEELVPATPKVNGYYREYCTVCDYEHKQIISRPQTVRLYDSNGYKNEFEYTGKPIKPNITVLDSAGNMIYSSSYKVSITNNVEVGTATVTIDFSNSADDRYNGIMTAEFKIVEKSKEENNVVLKAPSIISLQTGGTKNSICLYYTCSPNAAKYEIQYSTSSSFSGAKTLRVKASDNGSFCRSNITVDVNKFMPKTEKQYYVRVRAVDSNNKTTAWSQSKSVKIYVQG